MEHPEPAFTESVKQRAAVIDDNIFALDWRGARYWVKLAGPTRRTLWHRLGALAGRLSRNPLLRPTLSPGGRAAIRGELIRLEKVRQKGAPVPRPVASTEDWFAMPDCGATLQSLFKKKRLPPQQQQAVMLQAVTVIAELHRQGGWHGRPALKDMLWDGDAIWLVDFEEDPAAQLSARDCMVRDCFVLMHGLLRFIPAQGAQATALWRCYCRIAPAEVSTAVLAQAKRMNWLYYLTGLLRPVAGFDVRLTHATLALFRALDD